MMGIRSKMAGIIGGMGLLIVALLSIIKGQNKKNNEIEKENEELESDLESVRRNTEDIISFKEEEDIIIEKIKSKTEDKKNKIEYDVNRKFEELQTTITELEEKKDKKDKKEEEDEWSEILLNLNGDDYDDYDDGDDGDDCDD